LPIPSNDRHNTDIQVAAIGGAYGADRFHDDLPKPRWRGGRIAAATVLAMAVLGAASTFAYRALFGGLPAALPIVKVSTVPNNIAQNESEMDRSNTLGSREQLPIDIWEAPKTVPRIISAIPVSSRLSDSPSTAPGSAAVALLAPAPADPAPALDASMASDGDSDVARSVPPPASAPIPIPSSSEQKETAGVEALARAPDTAPGLDAPVASAVDSDVARSVAPPASAPVPIPASSELK